MKNFLYLLIIFTALGLIINVSPELKDILGLSPAPCSKPITYSIGTLDSRFGVTSQQLIYDIESASKVWNDVLDKTLIKYDANSRLKVNFIYDYRQQATAQQKEIDNVITSSKADYNVLKVRYESLMKQYTVNKTALETKYRTLQQSGDATQAEIDSYNRDRDTFNQSVHTLNSAANQLNALAKKLNINVNAYNAVGASAGEQFNEGEYVEDIDGKRINIYEFKNENQLVRVMEHEFGHALGLDHVNDPGAVMYYLNEGTNSKLTTSDIDELNVICNIK